MDWIEIKVDTTTEAVESITGIFYEKGAQGVVIEDPKDFLRQKEDGDWDYMEVPEGLDFEKAVVTAYLPEKEGIYDIISEIENKIKKLPEYGLNIGTGKITINSVSDTDWANEWKKYYDILHIGKKIVVKPSWKEYFKKEDEVVIELDPGMAFGTGTHETTIMCLEFIEKYIKDGFQVIDFGCGSGILSIALAKLGANRVFAIDKDEVAVKVTKENVDRNGLKDIVEVKVGDTLDIVKETVDLIVSNIIADVIIKVSDKAAFLLKEKGIFIASGIVKDKKERVKQAVMGKGLILLEEQVKGDWVALVFMKNTDQ